MPDDLTQNNLPLQESAIINLGTVEETVQVQDHEYLFNYTKVRDPDNNLTNLFRLAYKERSQQTWNICNGLLSKNFSVAKTQDIQAQIVAGLNGDIDTQKHYRQDTSVKSVFTLRNYTLNIVEEDRVRNILFAILTGLNSSESRFTENNSLSFNIINGFSGNFALQLNYGFTKSITKTENGQPDQTISLDNPFVLYEFSTRLIHSRTLNVSFEQVVRVRDNINAKISRFKQTPLNAAAMEDFSNKMPKKFVKRFLATWENWPQEFRNLYYASFMWAHLLDREHKVHDEIKLRGWVKDYFDRIDAVLADVGQD